MIKAIEGKITKKEPTYLWIKTASGLTYGVAVSLFTSPKLALGDVCELLITQIIKEDANLLFGFLESSEQRIFELMLKVNGIGPATALAVCSSLEPSAVEMAVRAGDIATFKKVPGIGEKTAKLLLAQLGDASFIAQTNANPAQNEAMLALESLGFKKENIAQVLAKCASSDTVSLIKEALKILKK